MPRLARALVPLLAVMTLGVGLVSAPSQAASKPTLTSMSGTAGPIAGGRTITITGKNFTKTSKVRFGSTYASSVKYSSSKKLIVVTPRHSAGKVDVRVKTSRGTSSIAKKGVFRYAYPPEVHTISPSAGPAGGGTKITIAGKYFTRTTKVRFGTVYSTDVEKISSTRFTAVAPAGSGGAVDVRVLSSGGWSDVTPDGSFRYANQANQPSLTSMSTTAGPLAGGKPVTITGKNFTKSSKVRFGTTYAPTVTYSSSTQITAVSPAHAEGKVDVRVETADGMSATVSKGVFRYAYPPEVHTISPSAGPAGGGTKITIAGKYFTRTTKVRFGTVYSTDVEKISSTRFTAVAPAGSGGAVDVQVLSSGGWSDVTPDGSFTYQAPPTITSLSSTQGSTAGGETITINGTAFTPDAEVTFGGSPATSVKVSSSSRLTAVAPKHSIGPAPVVVSTPVGQSKSTAETVYQYGTASQLRLNVGSFNVRVSSGYYSSRGPNEQPWTKRVAVVVDQIKREKLDVVGVQEASASKKYTATGVPQFQDLANRLGSPYKLTNTDRYCYKSDSAGNCLTGASSSDRIIYNSDRVKLLDEGTRKLDKRSATDGSGRYVVWATFQDKRTDKKFFFVNTHLEPNKGSSHQGKVRASQASIILNEIAAENTGDLPTILVGDLSTSKFDNGTPANVAHDMLTDDGFVDPLINTYKYRGPETLVSTVINGRYNSLNYFESAPATVHESYALGSYVDYILVRGGTFEMTDWHTVMDLDSSGKFAGVIPSDHNLITLTLGLP